MKSRAGEHRQPGGPAHVVVGLASSPVSRITLRWRRSRTACLDRDDLVEHLQVAAGQERAPVDHHVDLVGAGGHRVAGVGELDRPAAPARTGTRWPRWPRARPMPRKRALADGDQVAGRRRRRRPAGSVGSAGSGRSALAHSARTLPGVSAPSSVVRSTMRMARSIAHALAVGLDRAGAERRRAGLGADLVDAGQAVQEPPERRLGGRHVGQDVRPPRCGGHSVSVRGEGRRPSGRSPPFERPPGTPLPPGPVHRLVAHQLPMKYVEYTSRCAGVRRPARSIQA